MSEPLFGAVVTVVGLALAGRSIGIAMICGSIVYLWTKGLDVSIFAEVMLQGLYGSYTLLAIPLFILAADIMSVGTLADRLLEVCRAVVGRFRGGLGYVNVAASVIFSGMSGSAVADAVGMGRLVIQMMVKDGGYRPGYAAALTAATATVGPVIPPSIPMILYALISNQSVGYLFAAGLLPGVIMALALAVTNGVLARRGNFGLDTPVPLAEIPGKTIRAIPVLMLPVLLLGGIYGGVVTPTEAAALAALYALMVAALLYRSVGLVDLYRTFLASARSTATVGVLVAGAIAFNYVVAREQVPDTMAGWLASYDLSATGFLIAVNLLLLALGCLLDSGIILLIVVPVLLPTAEALGIDLVHFGVIVVINTMIGLITPPYGLLLLIVAGITGQTLRTVIVEILPFVAVLVAVLAVLTFWPGLVLALPRFFGYGG